MKVLVTGAAGFIGFHLSQRLVNEGFQVIGIDNLNPYYDVNLKQARLRVLENEKNFAFEPISIVDFDALTTLFEEHQFDIVCNLAAQAGVRHSLNHPEEYIQTNVVGFGHILEVCRKFEVKHLIYASSSSVYGLNSAIPFETNHPVDHPTSVYAATKRSNELLAHSYSHLFGLPTTGLRFFTVYGPWGRPDMAYYLFAQRIMKGESIKVFNHGNMNRDFTYIDDIVEGIFKIMTKNPPSKNPSTPATSPNQSSAPFKIYNIGNSQPVNLLEFIEILEKSLGKQAKKELLPMPKTEVQTTFADVNDLISDFNYQPNTSLSKGIQAFADWFLAYNKL